MTQQRKKASETGNGVKVKQRTTKCGSHLRFLYIFGVVFKHPGNRMEGEEEEEDDDEE